MLWGAAFGWLPVLLAAEGLRPRLRYDVRRWATVFPVGMYVACSFAVGAAVHASRIIDFARLWVWAGMGRHRALAGGVRGHGQARSAARPGRVQLEVRVVMRDFGGGRTG